MKNWVKWSLGGLLAGLLLIGLALFFFLPSIAPIIAPDAIVLPIVGPIVAPQVLFIGVTVVPLNLATNQDLRSNIIVTFSEAMDTSTVNENTFVVTGPNNANMKGVITHDSTDKVWTFNPIEVLQSNAVYTVTLTTGAKGVSGNSLVKNFVWSFTTSQAVSSGSSGSGSGSSDSGSTTPPSTPTTPPGTSPAGPAPVNLGSASNFVILAKSGISTTGATAIVGDIGVSPIDQTALTGFSETMDSTNEFSRSTYVTGKLYAADYTPPTPTYLTTAISDIETAYTNAAGRTNPTATELGAGNIDGMTLAPGLYKWSTGLQIPTGVTLSGGANDVWIFQVAQDLTIGNGAIVTLAGGAQAKNIFWQVGGQATLETTSDVKGNILSQTLIEMKTGAKLKGRMLAQTAVTLDSNTVTIAN